MKPSQAQFEHVKFESLYQCADAALVGKEGEAGNVPHCRCSLKQPTEDAASIYVNYQP